MQIRVSISAPSMTFVQGPSNARILVGHKPEMEPMQRPFHISDEVPGSLTSASTTLLKEAIGHDAAGRNAPEPVD